MAIESSVIPLPSELVVIPAAYQANGGEQSVILIILCATIGACIGASVNYVVAYFLGRPIIYAFANSRAGAMCLLNQQKVEVAEKYFDDHGAIGTLIGRLVPGIRHLISIPAGLARMNYFRFLFYTALGACVWNIILAGMGYYLADVVPPDQLDTAVAAYEQPIKYGIIILALAVVTYLIYKGKKK